MKISQLLIVTIIIIVVINGTIIEIEDQHEEKPSNPLVTLSLNKFLNINEGTFCVKFYITGNLIPRFYLFSTTSGRHTFTLRLHLKTADKFRLSTK